MEDSDDTPAEIEKAIAALEAQRGVLGSAITNTALAALRQRLAAIEKKPDASGQWLKQVSVLFVDVVDSTRISEGLDPEEVHAVMDGTLARLTSIVQAQRGQVLQYAGDSLLAVFGAHVAMENDAESAVRAGLLIIEEIPRLAARLKEHHGVEGFSLRAGINTGPVLLGGGVDAEGSIRGLTVNVAARMEQSAPKGGLRISHETYRHVRGIFDVVAEAPIDIKGIADPVRSYLVTSVGSRAFRVPNRGLDGVETRMVGRDAELDALRQTFDASARQRCLSVVAVVGDAGLGKSRLGLEFQAWVEVHRQPVSCFQARPQPHGNNVPYGLLRDLLAWHFQIADGDFQSSARARLASGLAQSFGARAEERTALIGQLIGLDYGSDSHVAGIADDPLQIRDRAFHALFEYFSLACEGGARPVLMLLEDLHWADQESIDFFMQFAAFGRGLPVMILCLTRPGFFDTTPQWGSGLDSLRRIDLPPLPLAGCRELVVALLGRLDVVPTTLLDVVTEGAEGNPYFAEELIAMLIDDRVILTDSEPWQLAPDRLAALRIPTTLDRVLQVRMDSLPAREKATLQQASVIGFVFWDEPLARIAHSAHEPLAALVRRELTHAQQGSQFPGAREFVFKHHLLHQVAYSTVLKASKRLHHRVVADWLVDRVADRTGGHLGLIAQHYERAGDVELAADYFQRAAVDASRTYANHASLDFIDRAIALTDPSELLLLFDRLRLRTATLNKLGRATEGADDRSRLVQIAQSLVALHDDDESHARAANARAAQALAAGQFDTALTAAATAAERARAAKDDKAELSALTIRSRAHLFLGRHDLAMSTANEVREKSRSIGDRRVESTALGQMGIIAFQRGEYGLARENYQHSLDLARAINDPSLETGMLNNLGEIERVLGNYDTAFELFETGRRLSQEIGQRFSEAYLLCNLGHLVFCRGEPGHAIALCEQALRMDQIHGDPDLHASLLKNLGHALLELGRTDEAATRYREAAEICRSNKLASISEPLAGLARALLALDEGGQARSTLDAVATHLESGGTLERTDEPLWIYLTCFHVFAAAEPSRANEMLRKAFCVLQDAAQRLGDADRQTFLTRVAVNREIVETWTKIEMATRAS